MRPAAHRKLVFERLEHRQLLSASPLSSPISVTLAANGSATQTGQLPLPGTQVGYKFTATQTGMLVVRETPTGSSLFPTNLTLYNSAQSKISSLYVDPAWPAPNASLTTRVVAQVTKGSTYYVVAAAQAGSIGSYQLQFVMDDVGDTPALASTVSLINGGAVTLVGSATQLGSINYASDVDVYKFTAVVPGGGAGLMTLRLVPQLGALHPVIDVYDANYLTNPNEAPLAENVAISSGTTYAQIVPLSVTAGSVYYVKASASINSVGSYQLQLSTVKDDGLPHTFAQADSAWQSKPDLIAVKPSPVSVLLGPLAVTGPGTTPPAGDPTTPPGIYGNIAYAGQADYVRFVAPVTGSMIIRQIADTGQGSKLDTFLYIYDSNQNLIISSNTTAGTTNSYVNFKIQAGATYYLKAAGFGNSTGAYQLQFSTNAADTYGNATIADDYPETPPFNAANAATALTLDPNTGAITSITDGATGNPTAPTAGGAPGAIDFLGDVDWFSFQAPFNGAMSVQETKISGSLAPQVSAYALDTSNNPTISLAGNNPGPIASFNVALGNTYYIKVAGASQTAGSYVLQAFYPSLASNAPIVQWINPNFGPAAGGTQVTISGGNLANAVAVYFGSTPATIVSDTSSQIVATSPPGSGKVDVTVLTSYGFSATSVADLFTYGTAPAWTSVGPAPINNVFNGEPTTGRVTAIAASPTDPFTYYVGTADGGVWKTSDGGFSYVPLTDNQASLSIGSIAIASSNENTIYVGTGEANFSGDSLYGIGVLKSTDGGLTWTLLGNSVFNRKAISKIVVDPTNANTVYAALTDQAANGLTGGTGVWKSTDGGTTWKNTTTAISTTLEYTDLVIDTGAPQTLYAAVCDPIFGSINGAVYETTNGGTSWAPAGDFFGSTTTMPPIPTFASAFNGRMTLAIYPSTPATPTTKAIPATLYVSIAIPAVYANDSFQFTSGLYQMLKSTDGGTTWVALLNVPDYLGSTAQGSQGWYDTTLAVSPTDPNVVYAGGVEDYSTVGTNIGSGINMIIESTDGGLTWTSINNGANGVNPHTDNHAMAFDAFGELLDGNDGGMWLLEFGSTPASPFWFDLNGSGTTGLSTLQFYGIALSPINPNIVYGGTQDNGTAEYNGNGTLAWNEINGGDGGYVRVDQTHPRTIYSEVPDGGIQRSDNGGTTWTFITQGLAGSTVNFIMPFIMDPSNSSRLLAGTDGIYETNNQGNLWTPISPAFSFGVPVDAIGMGPGARTIYASVGKNIEVTTSGGTTWTAVTPVATKSALTWSGIAVDSTNTNVVYISAANFNAETGGGHVWRSTDAGKTWTNVSTGLPDVPVRSLVVDPIGPASANDVIYAGTDNGVYQSTNGGTSWSLYGTGLPNAAAWDLELDTTHHILGVGTHGRGVWEIGTSEIPTTPAPIVAASAKASISGTPSSTSSATLANNVIGKGITNQFAPFPLFGKLQSATVVNAHNAAAAVVLASATASQNNNAPSNVVDAALLKYFTART